MRRYIVVYGFFISLVCVMLMMFTIARWYHYKNNDGYLITTKKVDTPYEDIHNPKSDTYYFHEIEVTKITKCATFPFVETIRTEKDKGGFQRKKQ